MEGLLTLKQGVSMPPQLWHLGLMVGVLLPTGSEEREVFGVGSIPVALSTSGCCDR